MTTDDGHVIPLWQFPTTGKFIAATPRTGQLGTRRTFWNSQAAFAI